MPSSIAVVEDDPVVGSMLEQILRLEGFKVTIFADGRAVLDALRSGTFDALVLDVMLPGKDGVAVMQDIRGEPRTRQLPVVMLTAKTDDASTWAGWQAGCDYYMTKPFDPEDLVRALRQLVGS